MKTNSLIKAFEKTGLKVTITHSFRKSYLTFDSYESISYSVIGPRNACTWRSCVHNEGEAVSVRVVPHNDKDEIETDYCAGVFANTVKSAVKWTLEA